MQNLKYGTNELIYKTERDSWIEKPDLLPRGRGSRQGWSGRRGSADGSYYRYRMDKYQGPTAQGTTLNIL